MIAGQSVEGVMSYLAGEFLGDCLGPGSPPIGMVGRVGALGLLPQSSKPLYTCIEVVLPWWLAYEHGLFAGLNCWVGKNHAKWYWPGYALIVQLRICMMIIQQRES